MTNIPDKEINRQDNFIEAKEPGEMIMCLILASAYAGIARYFWLPLSASGNFRLFFNIEGFFITIALLAIFLGTRPYLSSSSLQLSEKGIKYRGPYWPQSKAVNWDQIFRLYISPELIVVLYHPNNKTNIWPLFIQSIYLADRDRIPGAIHKYYPLEPIWLSGPSIISRIMLITVFAAVVLWIFFMLAK